MERHNDKGTIEDLCRKIYTYNIMLNKMIAVQKGANTVGATLVNISKEDLHKSIEYITGRSNSSKAGKDCEANITELLLFEGFDSQKLDVFLETYNLTGIQPVVYKAVLTPINVKWTPAYLYEHIKNEAAIGL